MRTVPKQQLEVLLVIQVLRISYWLLGREEERIMQRHIISRFGAGKVSYRKLQV